MNLIEALAGRFGFVREREKPKARRGFAAARTSRLTADWQVSSASEDSQIRTDLQVLRDRSRSLARDDDYVKRFLGMVQTNVAGPSGFRFVSEAIATTTGKPDARARKLIEADWKEWGRPESCTTLGTLSRSALECMAASIMARDGEVFARIVRGPVNEWGFTILPIEAEQVDHRLNVGRLANGNRISMGVEKSPWGRPVAYWVFDDSPNDSLAIATTGKHSRYTRDEMIHAFIPSSFSQSRGVPWCHTAAPRVRMLSKYEEAELVAARTAASKMGFLEPQPDKDGNYVGDGEDEDGNKVIEVAPGTIEDLPNGMKFVPWDPTHPHTNFNDFRKGILRGVAAGLGVSYNSLSNDYESVNYSSARAAALEEREMWILLQNWFTLQFTLPIFNAWLPQAVLSGRIKLPLAQIDRYKSCRFIGRRWSWVDPLKDIQAAKEAVQLRIKARSDFVSEMGGDFEDVMETFEADDQTAKEHNQELKDPDAPPPPTEPDKDDSNGSRTIDFHVERDENGRPIRFRQAHKVLSINSDKAGRTQSVKEDQ